MNSIRAYGSLCLAVAIFTCGAMAFAHDRDDSLDSIARMTETAANFVAFGRRAKTARMTKSQRSLLVLGIATIVAHLVAASGVLPWAVTIFVFGLIQQLFVAALNFVLLLFPLRSSA